MTITATYSSGSIHVTLTREAVDELLRFGMIDGPVKVSGKVLADPGVQMGLTIGGLVVLKELHEAWKRGRGR